MNEAEVQVIADSNIYGIFDYFPLLCVLYEARKPVQILDFFRNPIQSIKEDFKLLLNTKKSKTIATLMLFVVYNNNLTKNLLSEIVEGKRNELLNDISNSFHLETPFSSQDVLDKLNYLKRSYVKQYGDTYSMLHDKVFDIFLSFLCENTLDLVLTLAHTCILRDRFLFESLRDNELDENVINNVNIVPKANEDFYLYRLLGDITDGFIANVFWNKQNKHRIFRQRLVQFITHKIRIRQSLQKMSYCERHELLQSTIKQGYCVIVVTIPC